MLTWNQTLGHPDLTMLEMQLLLTVGFFISLPLNERPLGVSPIPRVFLEFDKIWFISKIIES